MKPYHFIDDSEEESVKMVEQDMGKELNEAAKRLLDKKGIKIG